ncbi:MAG: HEAT repeat domain-containing protein [Gemmatimonadaceae bacterium]
MCERTTWRNQPLLRRAKGAAARFIVAASMLALVSSCSADPGYEGRSADEWIRQLERSPDSLERRVAARALGKVLAINPGSERVTAALVRALADTSDDVRLDAGTALVQDRRLAASAMQGLLLALTDSAHEHTREHAAELLATSAPEDARDVVPGLIRALEDPSPRVRESVMRALAHLKNTAGTMEALRNAAATGTAAARDGARQVLELQSGIPLDPLKR